MPFASTSIKLTTLLLLIFNADPRVWGVASGYAAPVHARHAYIAAIPFQNMKLDAPVVTSLENASRRQCGLSCLREPRCRSFNYHVTQRACYLLSDFLCSNPDLLIPALGFRHYDFEKDGDIKDFFAAQKTTLCRNEAMCSPKCSCPYHGVQTFNSTNLVSDEPPEITMDMVSDASCKMACLGMPLDLCRSFTVEYIPSAIPPFKCRFLPIVASQRPPSSLQHPVAGFTYNYKGCFNSSEDIYPFE